MELEEILAARRAQVLAGLATLAETRDGHFLRVVHSVMPAPELLRRLAAYVDIDELRKIEDPRVIAERFGELRAHLLRWAAVLEVTREGE